MPNELITLQLGHYANFVGTHFWNLQEASFSYNPKQPTSDEIDLNILHREGQTLQGDSTFTPRVVICDYQGSLKSLRKSGGLYKELDEKSVPPWEGALTRIEEPPERPNSANKFLAQVAEEQNSTSVIHESLPKKRRHADYSLESSVEVWSDFAGVAFHPRSLSSLDKYWINDQPEPFDVFGVGLEEWKNKKVQASLEDSIRYFVEECENMQGFQVLMDGHDGFAGLGTAVLDHLADEYGSKSVLVYPLFPTPLPESGDAKKDFFRLFNYALSVAGSSDDHGHNAYVPLSTTSRLSRPKVYLDRLPYARFQQIPYHTSAILAGAVDSFSLVNRLSSPDFVHLRDVVDAITVHHRKVAAMSTMLPFPLRDSDSLFSALKAIDAEYLPVTSLTPHVKTPLIDSQNRCYSQVMSLRGVPRQRWQCTPEEIQSYRLSYEVASMPATQLFENFMSSYCPNTFGIGRVTEFPLHTAVPYPQFFSDNISENGYVIGSKTPRIDDVKRLPVMAGIHSTDKVKDLLTELTTVCQKQNLAKYPRLLDGGMEAEDYKESFERLVTLTERYGDEK
ncbi:Protein misato-like protein 1 [Hypsibius exemplaris]|uniref:Protein misato-like protein 1 n=1 Tax=Hypsibius exemplaris TaxID=2072580 RepID=A0A1W0WJK3_HYPEX|nr:Protein misato-like protein 1 [Hypsibius exemplaris]